MINWDQLDFRLAGIGKDRTWLGEKTPYSLESIRNAMAPASTRRSDRMLSVLSRAIEDEEEKHRSIADVGKILEFEPEEWEQIITLATRAGQSPGQWIRSQILAYLAYRNPVASKTYPEIVRSSLKVAGVDPTGSSDTPDPIEPPEKNGTNGDA